MAEHDLGGSDEVENLIDDGVGMRWPDEGEEGLVRFRGRLADEVREELKELLQKRVARPGRKEKVQCRGSCCRVALVDVPPECVLRLLDKDIDDLRSERVSLVGT
ncbi:MAG TPA: hypothetical protein VF883_03020 [Thermoanaerobaculia bacterium]